MIVAIALYLLGGLALGLFMAYWLRGGPDDKDLLVLVLVCMAVWPLLLVFAVADLLLRKG